MELSLRVLLIMRSMQIHASLVVLAQVHALQELFLRNNPTENKENSKVVSEIQKCMHWQLFLFTQILFMIMNRMLKDLEAYKKGKTSVLSYKNCFGNS